MIKQHWVCFKTGWIRKCMSTTLISYCIKNKQPKSALSTCPLPQFHTESCCQIHYQSGKYRRQFVVNVKRWMSRGRQDTRLPIQYLLAPLWRSGFNDPAERRIFLLSLWWSRFSSCRFSSFLYFLSWKVISILPVALPDCRMIPELQTVHFQCQVGEAPQMGQNDPGFKTPNLESITGVEFCILVPNKALRWSTSKRIFKKKINLVS